MSKPTSRASGGGASKVEDICPVCKSSRYLNQNMKFLVNPECYHKMCESCVDRIFSHGPAPCPIAGCPRTLRKAKFRTQTFEDLKVEREVDIRRRVARAFNKNEADFDTLKDFNDYLETVEEVTWNLILKENVEETEKRLRKWEEAQRIELNPNARFRAYQNDPSLPSETSHVVLKKGGTQRKVANLPSGSTPDPSANGDNAEDRGFKFHGLKKYVPPEPEQPYDPFDGWSVEPQYFVLQDEYNAGWVTQQTKDNPAYMAGGYDIRDFYSRALCEAFGGFGVFIDDEITARENLENVSGDANIGTKTAKAAAVSGKEVNMDDVF